MIIDQSEQEYIKKVYCYTFT